MADSLHFVMSLDGVFRCTNPTEAWEVRARQVAKHGEWGVASVSVCPAHPSAGWLR